MIPEGTKTLSFVPMLIVLVCMPFSCKRERAVSCVSKSLMPIETRYVTHDLVLLAIDFVLQNLASLFLGEKFVLYPDHESWEYLFSHKEHDLRQPR